MSRIDRRPGLAVTKAAGLAMMFVLGLLAQSCRPAPSVPESDGVRSAPLPPDSVYVELRKRALTSTRTDVGLEDAADSNVVWGVVVDHGLPNGTATLVCFANGDASLYLSSGGGLAGANTNATVRSAATNLVFLAQRHLTSAPPVESWPMPGAGQVAFWFLVDDKVLGVCAPDKELRAGGHPLTLLYQSANTVLTRLHLAAGEIAPLPATNQSPAPATDQPVP